MSFVVLTLEGREVKYVSKQNGEVWAYVVIGFPLQTPATVGKWQQ
jgi:hypothetical protein